MSLNNFICILRFKKNILKNTSNEVPEHLRAVRTLVNCYPAHSLTIDSLEPKANGAERQVNHLVIKAQSHVVEKEDSL